MNDQATVLRGMIEQQSQAIKPAIPAQAKRAKTLAVTSGKGGVGKTNIALNLSLALAEQNSRVCLLDANLGLGNIDLLCGLNGYWNLSHVLTGARTLKQIMLNGPNDINVIPGVSDLTDLSKCPEQACQDILEQLEELEYNHDFVIIDTGSGIQQGVRPFLHAAEVILLVTTPEPTSLADTYATIKSLIHNQENELLVLVNQTLDNKQGRAVIERLRHTAKMFVQQSIGSAGSIPHDVKLMHAVAHRQPLLLHSPNSPAAIAIKQLAERLNNITELPDQQAGFFSRFWKSTQSQSCPPTEK